MIIDSAVRSVLHTVLGLLVEGHYDTLATMTQQKNLTAEEMRQAIDDYGRTLVEPPDDELPPGVEVIVKGTAFPRQTFVMMPLYSLEEGMSDLSVELTLTEVAPDLWHTVIDNIRVM